MLELFVFLFITHTLVFTVGWGIALYVNKQGVKQTGVCACANVYTYEVVQDVQ